MQSKKKTQDPDTKKKQMMPAVIVSVTAKQGPSFCKVRTGKIAGRS